MPRSVLEQALDAMEGCRIEYDYHGNPMDASDRDVIEASAALRAALKQQQVEQVDDEVKPWKCIKLGKSKRMV